MLFVHSTSLVTSVIFPLLILQITSFQFHHFAVLHPLHSPVVVMPTSSFMYLHARQVVRNHFSTRWSWITERASCYLCYDHLYSVISTL